MKTILMLIFLQLSLTAYADTEVLRCSNGRGIFGDSSKRIDLKITRGNEGDRVEITGAITFEGTSLTYPPTDVLTYGFKDSSDVLQYSIEMNVCEQGDVWRHGKSLSWMECWGPDMRDFKKTRKSDCSE